MGEFASWAEYDIFAEFITRKARYVRDERSESFLRALQETSKQRERPLQATTDLWRAQVGHEWQTAEITSFMRQDMGIDGCEIQTRRPYDAKRMMPRPDRATEGRVNPEGLPCLYCAMEEDTAVSECRPGLGSYVSVARFRPVRPLRIVDCTVDDPGWTLNYYTGCEEPSPKEREMAVWGSVNFAFSEPVTRSDDVADYAPTQVIAEVFRNCGYDGIVYESRLRDEGKNVALFDLGAATFLSCRLYQVDGVQLSFTSVPA